MLVLQVLTAKHKIMVGAINDSIKDINHHICHHHRHQQQLSMIPYHTNDFQQYQSSHQPKTNMKHREYIMIRQNQQARKPPRYASLKFTKYTSVSKNLYDKKG